MFGAHFIAWMILIPVILAAIFGALTGLAFAVVAGLTAANHGLALWVRRTVDGARERRARARAAGAPLAEPASPPAP